MECQTCGGTLSDACVCGRVSRRERVSTEMLAAMLSGKESPGWPTGTYCTYPVMAVAWADALIAELDKA